MVTPSTSFGRKLRSELDRQGLSVRELARRLRPDDPESARRNVARWLAPEKAVTPSRATINQVAAAVGVDTVVFADDEEGRDLAPLSADEFAMLGALMSRLGPTLARPVEVHA